MARLRTEDGRAVTGHRAINEVIAPTRLDAVGVPSGIDALLELPSLTPAESARLLAHADAALEAERVRAGWPPPLVQVFFPGMPSRLEDLLAGFAPPHTNPADEIHHLLDGAIEFGLVLDGGAQVLVLVEPGDALRLHAGTEHWSVLTAAHRSKAILYLSKPPGYPHSYTGTTVRIT